MQQYWRLLLLFLLLLLVLLSHPSVMLNQACVMLDLFILDAFSKSLSNILESAHEYRSIMKPDYDLDGTVSSAPVALDPF